MTNCLKGIQPCGCGCPVCGTTPAHFQVIIGRLTGAACCTSLNATYIVTATANPCVLEYVLPSPLCGITTIRVTLLKTGGVLLDIGLVGDTMKWTLPNNADCDLAGIQRNADIFTFSNICGSGSATAQIMAV